MCVLDPCVRTAVFRVLRIRILDRFVRPSRYLVGISRNRHDVKLVDEGCGSKMTRHCNVKYIIELNIYPVVAKFPYLSPGFKPLAFFGKCW